MPQTHQTGQHEASTGPAAALSAQIWKLRVSYDGTDFHGWQIQPGLRTIQGTLSDTLFHLTGERLLPQGSGRTDTGVHALAQTVSLALHAPIPPDRLLTALNRILPIDLRILSAEHASPDFHARANVLNKTYEYRIFQSRPGLAPTDRPCPPTLARYVWDCSLHLNLQSMQLASQHVCGTHDFTSFAAVDPDRTRRLQAVQESRLPEHSLEPFPSNIRTIESSTWHIDNDGILLYTVTGNGFLHHMVRNLVGTFVDAGAGRIDPTSIPAILSAADRAASGPTAPPQGLFLKEVVYR